MGAVLIVDDNPMVRLCHRGLLNRLGCKVVEAADGEEAITLLNDGIDLVLTDLHMPNMDGIAFIKTAKYFNTGIKIIAVSGSFSVQEGEDSLAAGALEVLKKPLLTDDLKRLLTCYMNERSHNDARVNH